MTLDEWVDPISDESKLVLAIKEVGREIGIRRNVYAKWVKAGRLTQTQSDLQIRNMEFAYAFLKGLLKLGKQGAITVDAEKAP